MNSVDLHIENDFFVRTISIPYIRGLKVIFPKNIFLSLEQDTIIYEIDDTVVTIYLNGVKEKTITCPAYCARYLVAVDVTCKAVQRGISTKLMRAYDIEGNVIEDNNGAIVKLIDRHTSKSVNTLEDSLDKAISTFFGEEDDSQVTEDILDGFRLIVNHYKSEVPDE